MSFLSRDPPGVDRTFEITEAERDYARAIAFERIEIAKKNHLNRHRWGLKKGYDPNSVEVLGAIGELAAAKWLGIEWDPHRKWSWPDLGRFLQVRTTDLPGGRLIVRPGDRPSDVFVLMIVTGLSCKIAGWILGNDARQERFSEGPAGRPNAWFVPQARLNPPEELIALCA